MGNILVGSSTSKPVYAAYATLSITTNMATAVAANCTSISNTTNLYEDALLFCKFVCGASGTSATGYINIFGYGSIDGGTTFPENIATTSGTPTLSTPPNLQLIAQLTANANNKIVQAGPFSFCRMGGWDRLPPIWGIAIQNVSGATLTTGGFIQWMGVNGALV